MNKKYKELGKNTVIFGISLLLSKLVSSLLIPLYTRSMSTEEYGAADLVTTITGFIVPICSLSIHEAVYRFSLDNRYDRKVILRCGINVAWGAALAMTIVGMLTKIYEPVSEWTVYLISISILTMVRNILSLYTKADNRILLFGADSVLCNFTLGIVSVIFLVQLSLGINGYFLATLVSLAASILLLSVRGKLFLLPRYERGDNIFIRQMIRYSAPLILNSISWILMSLVDRIMLTSLYSSSANGIYAVASKIPTLLTIMTSIFTQAWGLSLIRDYESDRDDKFYNNVYDLFHLIVLLGTSLILIFTNNIFKLVIGEGFSEAVQYIAVLMMGTLFLTYSNFFSSVYSAAKKPSKIAISSTMGLVLNIVLNAALIPKSGIMGACIATAGSYIFIGLFRMIDCRKYIDLTFDMVRWIVSIILLIIQCIFVTLNKNDILVSMVVFMLLSFLYKRLITKIILKIWHKFAP